MHAFLADLGLDADRAHSGVATGSFLEEPGGEAIASLDPATGETIAHVRQASLADYEEVLERADAAFLEWRALPLRVRADLIRRIGDGFRARKEPLAQLISREMGKILPEARLEVQEVIDACDSCPSFAEGLESLAAPSAGTGPGLVEQWHPLGVVGLITSFDFPVALWAQSAFRALCCGNVVVWKPSHSAPLAAIAAQRIAAEVLAEGGVEGVLNLVVGRSKDIGEALLADHRVSLVAATGSRRLGRRVAEVVGGRSGRTLLGLGRDGARIVLEEADQDQAFQDVLSGALATGGQRCNSIRRLILHRAIAKPFAERLQAAYTQVRIGDPLEPGVAMGPLVDELALEQMLETLAEVHNQGGGVLAGGQRLTGADFERGSFIQPALVRAHPGLEIAREELCVPILFIYEVESLEQAVRLHDALDAGSTEPGFESEPAHICKPFLRRQTVRVHRGGASPSI